MQKPVQICHVGQQDAVFMPLQQQSGGSSVVVACSLLPLTQTSNPLLLSPCFFPRIQHSRECPQQRTSLSRRAFLAALSSGLYLSSSLNTVSARFLSAVFVNRFSAGGTCRTTPILNSRLVHHLQHCRC